jgi:hypothetical protein
MAQRPRPKERLTEKPCSESGPVVPLLVSPNQEDNRLPRPGHRPTFYLTTRKESPMKLLCLIAVTIAVQPLVIGILGKINTFSKVTKRVLPWLPWEHQEYFIPVGAIIVLALLAIGIAIGPQNKSTNPTKRKDTTCGNGQTSS